MFTGERVRSGPQYSHRVSASIDIKTLTRAFAEAHVDRLTQLLNRIPLLDYTADDVLAEVSSRAKPLTDKWRQSLVAVNGDEVIGVLIAYVKRADSPYYPEDSCYLSEIAIDERWERRGIARTMTEQWLSNTKGSLPHSLQTNSAESNQPVADFYRRLGFEEVSSKAYDNRVDLMMFRFDAE
jgi:ribosomal protein S18 acetylase RimI-like enzyme